MHKKKLTAQFANANLKSGRYYDLGYYGLHLHVRRSGSKAWVQRTRFRKKYIDIGIGGFPKVSLVEARKTATENSLLIFDNIDPRTHLQQIKVVPTFEEVAEIEILRAQAQSKNEKHRRQWRSTLEQYAFPTLGKFPINNITVNDVLSALEPIWKTKTETATRVRGRIESVIDAAIVRGYREGPNPAAWRGNLEKLLPAPAKITKVTHHPAISQKDMQRWWKALADRQGVSKLALQALTLTCSRSGEIRNMSWDQVELFEEERAQDHLFKGVWKKPAKFMKAGRADYVPITSPLLSILKQSGTKSGLIFLSPRSASPLSDMAMTALMRDMDKDDEIGFRDEDTGKTAVPHGLRSTFRDWAAITGKSREVAVKSQIGILGILVVYRKPDG